MLSLACAVSSVKNDLFQRLFEVSKEEEKDEGEEKKFACVYSRPLFFFPSVSISSRDSTGAAHVKARTQAPGIGVD